MEDSSPLREAKAGRCGGNYKVTRFAGGNIDVGQLKIIGKEEKELAQSIGQNGDLTYNIETSSEAKVMSLRVDATKLGPYKKNILVYTYHKL